MNKIILCLGLLLVGTNSYAAPFGADANDRVLTDRSFASFTCDDGSKIRIEISGLAYINKKGPLSVAVEPDGTIRFNESYRAPIYSAGTTASILLNGLGGDVLSGRTHYGPEDMGTPVYETRTIQYASLIPMGGGSYRLEGAHTSGYRYDKKARDYVRYTNQVECALR